MGENVLTVLALVASTAAIVLTVSAAASTKWVGDEVANSSPHYEIHCGLAQCCDATAGVERCTGAVRFVSDNLEGGSMDVKPADVTVTIVCVILSIMAGLLSWGYALKTVFSDAADAAIRTCGKLGFIHVVFTVMAVAVYGASKIDDDLTTWLQTSQGHANAEAKFGWGFWVLVGALCAQAFAVILFLVAPSVVPAPKAKPQFSAAAPTAM